MTKRTRGKRREANGGKRRLVYHVFHWDQRYAVSSRDWPADRGLLFLRQFVAPVDTESTQYFGQLRDLRTAASDGATYHRWKSLWEDLRAMTATQARIHQGYLCDHRLQPLSEAQIAARLHESLDDTRQVLRALCAANLMERVPLPSFADLKRAQADSERSCSRDNDSCAAQEKQNRRSCAQTVAEPATGAAAEPSENGPGAGEKRDSGPWKGGGIAGPPGDNGPPPLKGNGLNGNGNPNRNETANGCAEANGQAEGKPNGQGERSGQAAVEPCPPSTQPIKPKGAEAEGVGQWDRNDRRSRSPGEPGRQTGSMPPPPSVDGHTSSLTAATQQVIRRLSADAQIFADNVYHRLRLPDPVNSEEWRRQVAAIGGIWVAAETSLPGEHREAFRAWAYARADYWSEHASECRSHIRKWMSDAKFETKNRRKKLGRLT